MTRPTPACVLLLGSLLLGLMGCAANPPSVEPLLREGELGRARVRAAAAIEEDPRDRNYLLSRLRLAILSLDDGYPTLAGPVFERVYELLRLQGLNADRTVSSVVLYEGVRFWKGEPFEQALGFTYYAMQQAALGAWGNARAASGNALFQLRDFSGEVEGDSGSIDAEAIARRALAYERGEADDYADAEAFLNTGYAVRESDFVLGYLLRGVAAQQLGRQREAFDHYAVALQIRPRLREVVETLRRGDYNVVLVVAYGLGPVKTRYGPDGALSRFQPRTASDDAPLRVLVGASGPALRAPWATDVNRMARDHRWNNLEDIRVAKSYLGSAMVVGGLIAADAGARNDSKTTTAIGAGVAALGLLMKAGARADIRYCDVMAQRYYLVPLRLPPGQDSVMLQVEGVYGSRLVLRGLAPPDGRDPTDGFATLRSVRLLTPGRGAWGVASGVARTPTGAAPPRWAVSGEVYYGNPVTGPVGDLQPWVLGGRHVAPPLDPMVLRYQRAGYFRGLTAGEVQTAYAEEGLAWTPQTQAYSPVLHVLEGGYGLLTPQGGTTGFMRLFGAPSRASFRPRSDLLRARWRPEASAPESLEVTPFEPIGRPAP